MRRKNDSAGLLWLYEEGEDYPLEYYIKRDDFDESEFADEDYGDNSTNLLHRIEERWCW